MKIHCFSAYNKQLYKIARLFNIRIISKWDKLYTLFDPSMSMDDPLYI